MRVRYGKLVETAKYHLEKPLVALYVLSISFSYLELFKVANSRTSCMHNAMVM